MTADQREKNEGGRSTLLRQIPRVDDLIRQEGFSALSSRWGEQAARDALRQVLDRLRSRLKSGATASLPSVPEILEAVGRQAAAEGSPRLKKVVNGTGVIIHTNLGRSLLAPAAREAVTAIASSYSNLEYDVEEGRRGDRYEHCRRIIERLTGAEASLVVNNNAAAVLLVLNTLAEGRHVVISRGELVEIGGSFRIPDVMEKSGAILREVGTTNRTFIEDYRRAIEENSGLLMRAHTSNYRVRGYVHEASVAELVALSKERGIPFYFDAGSGLLFDLPVKGAQDEPVLAQEVRNEVDVISFSGDKLLGGPQAGIVIGRARYVEAMKKNPLTRALRPDKYTLAALEATLLLYLDPDRARREIPTLKMICEGEETLKRRAGRLVRTLRQKGVRAAIAVQQVPAEVGGGSLPDVTIPSYALAIDPPGGDAAHLEERLRGLSVPIIGRIEKDKLLLDVRTIPEEDEAHLLSGLQSILGNDA